MLMMSQLHGFNTGGEAPVCDPYRANVSLLLLFNGANGGSTFTEETGKSVVLVGSPKTYTTAPKFGSAYGASPDGGSLDIAYDLISDFDGLDGTIDFWIYGTGTGNYIFSQESPFNYGLSAYVTAAGLIQVYVGRPVNGINLATITTTGNVLGGWHFVRITKSGATWKIAIDGVESASQTLSDASVYSDGSTNFGVFNRRVDSTAFVNKLDCLRVTSGIVRSLAEVPSAETAYAAC